MVFKLIILSVYRWENECLGLVNGTGVFIVIIKKNYQYSNIDQEMVFNFIKNN